MIHIGLLHLVEKLPCVGREALHIATLPLGKERIEGKRGLPRTARPGDDDELVAGNLDVKVAQVVLPRPLDADDIGVTHERIKAE